MIFDTGAYMTTIDSILLEAAGYDLSEGDDTKFDVVGQKGVPAKEILLRGLELGGKGDKRIPLGPVLVYATDMSSLYTSAVVGLNVIREFETRIAFGNPTYIEVEPIFDVNAPVRFDDFHKTESRFGLWSREQVEGNE
jgi:hypothetical protein